MSGAVQTEGFLLPGRPFPPIFPATVPKTKRRSGKDPVWGGAGGGEVRLDASPTSGTFSPFQMQPNTRRSRGPERAGINTNKKERRMDQRKQMEEEEREREGGRTKRRKRRCHPPPPQSVECECTRCPATHCMALGRRQKPGTGCHW